MHNLKQSSHVFVRTLILKPPTMKFDYKYMYYLLTLDFDPSDPTLPPTVQIEQPQRQGESPHGVHGARGIPTTCNRGNFQAFL